MKKSIKDKKLKKILTQGFRLAHKRMVKEKIKNDEYVIVEINGKVVRKKAREVYLK